MRTITSQDNTLTSVLAELKYRLIGGQELGDIHDLSFRIVITYNPLKDLFTGAAQVWGPEDTKS
ncbi:MAG: hypothetical protein M1281_02850 [Chloroflexi bacterium]|nr:hypothetical protein [Chloroflexota bacterium]